MALEVLHILQHEKRRFFGGEDARHIKKQRALGFTFKTVRATQRILLTDAGQRKGLTGKAGQQHLMVGNRLIDMLINRLLIRQTGRLGNQPDITVELMPGGIAVVIGFIGAHRFFIPLAGEYALATNLLKAAANSPDAGKQIDKLTARARHFFPREYG